MNIKQWDFFTFAKSMANKAMTYPACIVASAALFAAANSYSLEAPTGIKGYGGGNSVVLVWPRSTSPNGAYYQIFRDEQPIGWQQSVPVSTPVVTFVDTASLSQGATYNYQIIAWSVSSVEVSPPSAAVSVTIPTFTVPIPNIELDYAIAPETIGFMESLKVTLQIWYPKISALIAAPTYMPPSAIGLKLVDDGCTNPMWVGDDYWIHVCVNYVRTRTNTVNYQDISLVVHEGTHLIQSYFSGIPSVDEGIGTWAGDLTEGKIRSIPGEEMSFLNGYEYSAAFFTWIMDHYPSSNLVRYLNIQAHDQIFDFNWFAESTGKKVNQLWQEMTGVAMTPPQHLVHGTGLCGAVLDNFGLSTRCIDVNSQTFVYEPVAQRLRVEAHCVGVDADSKINLVSCTSFNAHGWTFEQHPNYVTKEWGQWRHSVSNKCMQLESVPGSMNDPYPTLNAAPCDAQNWAQVWRPFSD